jgi:hypothetical protein
MNEKPPAGKARSDHMNHYLEVLGLRAGASMEEINTTYFTIIERFPENPTEEEEARIGELKRAYDMLRRAYEPPRRKPARAILGRRHLAPIGGVLAAVLAVVAVMMNYPAIRTKLVHHEPGVTLRLKSASEPYGVVVGYESRHRFQAGRPGPAYAIRLARGGETVWVGERLVVNGMEPARPK